MSAFCLILYIGLLEYSRLMDEIASSAKSVDMLQEGQIIIFFLRWISFYIIYCYMEYQLYSKDASFSIVDIRIV